MISLKLFLAGCAVAVAATLCACVSVGGEDDSGLDESNVEAVDPLEGAYAKQGGTPLHFVFRRGAADEEDVFFGEIDVDGAPQRADGTAIVGRDKLGTTLTLTPKGVKTKPKAKDAGADSSPAPAAAADGGAGDAGKPADTRPIAEQAFSGTVHFLKIGKNDTLLVRGDENGKTAQYKKLKSWCGTGEEADCADDVQRTGLDCQSNLVCTSAAKCACGQ